MAEAGSSGDGGNGDVWPRVVEAEGPQIDDQTTEQTIGKTGAVAATGGDEARDLLHGVGDGGDRRTPVPEGRMPVGVETGSLWLVDWTHGVPWKAS